MSDNFISAAHALIDNCGGENTIVIRIRPDGAAISLSSLKDRHAITAAMRALNNELEGMTREYR